VSGELGSAPPNGTLRSAPPNGTLRPWNLVAELSYRCPLRCAYCSNPLDFARVDEALDAPAWAQAFREAAELGAVHVGLTGGEPAVRRDLEAIVAGAAEAGLYPHLVTSGIPLGAERLAALQAAGLRSVQLSLQDVEPAAAAALAGADVFERKLAFARAVRALDLPLTLNVVLHRRNLARTAEIIALARSLDADKLELANVQLHGFALANRAALLPTRAALDAAARVVAEARAAGPRPEILFVLPDWWSDRPKPCMGGWARKTIVIAPDGLVLPCHAARGLPDLVFHRFPAHALRACWEDAPGMRAFRGEGWMRAPCRDCPERGRDHGGCRCQAFALAGDPAEADPACAKAPRHDVVLAARTEAGRSEPAPPLVLRSASVGI